MNASVQPIDDFISTTVHVPGYPDHDVQLEIARQLMQAMLVVIRKTGIKCQLIMNETYVGLVMGHFCYRHQYDDPEDICDGMIVQLAFNALCAGMTANGIRQNYF